ncbi:hypothetical protein BWQ96_00182 [Gracilariopsis chorda]|uniref:Protein translocase subunit SecE n=1 Tax=Gracilariopsis chorda TaxID=448386 RepID=A0A2V3J7K8_9FLOR|nr:hypothetical protein BWQ96_00182 [Gracilariopsis chorda]|eukprot:PXF50022.1 hypothetical protein BWQ96_00182 [Gracilariopsis chorda]
MMAKFQQQNTNTEQPDGESQLEDIVPKELPLPTLTTLTGVQQRQTKTPEDETNQVDTTEEIDLSQISAMGPGLSTAEEQSLIRFLQSAFDELKQIEWPSAGRVVRLTAIIIVTVIIAVIALYFVDGFFYRVSHILFEGKI